MSFNISLRARLTYWYSAIVAISLILFGVFTYISVSNEMRANLDASLDKVISSLDVIVNEWQQHTAKSKTHQKSYNKQKKSTDRFELFRRDEQNRFVGPLRPSIAEKKKKSDAENNLVWTAIYEHILLNPKNYFIQIADTSNKIIWRSQNLKADTLPILSSLVPPEKLHADSINKNENPISKFLPFKIAPKKIDSAYTNITIDNQEVRLLIKKTKNAMITIGYTVDDMDRNLRELFSSLIISIPIILIISIFGGLILSKLSLRTIDHVVQTADEITASNLSRRLPEPKIYDELGHLTHTLNRMIERLEESFIKVRQFTSDASHELRTPLTILRGELEIALHSVKSANKYQEIIASALDEVIRLSNVVQSLLELSRADTGRVELNLTNSNLSQLIMDIADDVIILSESKNIQVTTEIEDNIFINMDIGKIHQAVLNLIDNAIKYTLQNGKISIRLTDSKEFASLEVSDTGIGIPKEQLPYIFDRFYRVDKARSSDIQGSGLGLSIVKWIIDSHNGKIIVESTPNIGTSFVINLPK